MRPSRQNIHLERLRSSMKWIECELLSELPKAQLLDSFSQEQPIPSTDPSVRARYCSLALVSIWIAIEKYTRSEQKELKYRSLQGSLGSMKQQVFLDSVRDIIVHNDGVIQLEEKSAEEGERKIEKGFFVKGGYSNYICASPLLNSAANGDDLIEGESYNYAYIMRFFGSLINIIEQCDSK